MDTINNEKEYEDLRNFVLVYIEKLLKKKHIWKKKELRETYNYLHQYGYLKNKYQCKFIHSFLRSDKKLTTTYPIELLEDLKRYKFYDSSPNNLEKFFS